SLFETDLNPDSSLELIQVLGPLEPVVAAPGDDITLKCLVDPKFDIGGKTVEWSKLDLQVNPADPSYVYLYRNRREDVLLMFPSYVGRTKLSTEALKDGNILLLIKNVTLSDNGQYRCFIPDLKSSSRHSTVTLVVGESVCLHVNTEWSFCQLIHMRTLTGRQSRSQTQKEKVKKKKKNSDKMPHF
uniref:Ig-like domain-containing protein n=1 Tax=Sphaeramia orbicularis TaxID=375764 RepID=A0A673AD26_9TELE